MLVGKSQELGGVDNIAFPVKKQSMINAYFQILSLLSLPLFYRVQDHS